MSEPSEPSERLLVATMWNGPRVVQRLYSTQRDPTTEELDTIAGRLVARNHGIKPVVRVVARSRYVPPTPEAA